MDSKALVAKWKEIGVPDELLPRNTRDVDWLFYESSGRSFLHWFLLPGVTTTITPSHCLTDQELEERACKREEGLYLSGAELLEAVNAVTDNNGKGKGKGEDTDGENDALQRSDRLQDEIARLEVELDQRERLLADKKRRRDMLCRAKEREETDDSPPSLAQPSFPSSALSSSSSAASGKGGSALSASRAVEESQQELHQLYSATEQLMKWLRGDGGNGEDKNGDDEDVSPLLMDANVHPYLVQEDLLCGAVKQCVCATTSTLLRSNNSDDLSLAEGKSNLTSSLSHHPQYRLCCKELGRLRQSETVGTALRIKSAVRLARAKAQLDAAKVWIIRFSAQDHHSSNTRENTRHKHAALHLQRTQRMVSRHLNHTLPALLEDLRKSASEGVTVRVLQSDYSDKEQRQVEVRSALARAEKEVVDCQARVLLLRLSLEEEAWRIGQQTMQLLRAVTAEVKQRREGKTQRCAIAPLVSLRAREGFEALVLEWREEMNAVGNARHLLSSGKILTALQEDDEPLSASMLEMQERECAEKEQMMCRRIEEVATKLSGAIEEGEAWERKGAEEISALETALNDLVRGLEGVISAKALAEGEVKKGGKLKQTERSLFIHFYAEDGHKGGGEAALQKAVDGLRERLRCR